jgi:hypothetical protein
MTADTKMDSPRTIFITSVLISITLILLSLLYFHHSVTTGLLIGALVSNILFVALWWTVNHLFRRKETAKPLKTAFAIKILILKFPVLGFGLYFALRYLDINVFALVAGISVSYVAIFIAGMSKLLYRYGAIHDSRR